jgi:hypothetical protein
LVVFGLRRGKSGSDGREGLAWIERCEDWCRERNRGFRGAKLVMATCLLSSYQNNERKRKGW